jgi:hypothetical protein
VRQTKLIAAFYLGYVVSDIAYQILGNLLFDPNKDFLCKENGTVAAPINNAGAIYMLIHSLILLSFSVMVLLVFYIVPARQFKLVGGSERLPRMASGTLNTDPHASMGVENLIKLNLADDSEDPTLASSQLQKELSSSTGAREQGMLQRL